MDQKTLKQLLRYEPETGDFYWIVRGRKRRLDSPAGWTALNGYRYISIAHKMHLAHRLAWLYVHGYFPSAEIDHQDGDALNNRICNLRLASSSQNKMNRRASVNKSSGVRGVFIDRRRKNPRIYAAIKKDGKKIYLGSFSSIPEAEAAYKIAAADLFKEFAVDHG